MLCATLKGDTNDKNQTEKMNRQNANASAKSKELQPTSQSQRFAAHLLLPQRTTRINNESGILKNQTNI
jgi:hypothetical protein